MKEAYVSYETAKLLKEKGFKGFTMFSYSNRGTTMCGHWENEIDWVPKCTHQMATAWLREVYNIFILVGWNPIHKEYFTRIFNMTDGCPKRNIHEHAGYEDAVEAAIKYCLENLI